MATKGRSLSALREALSKETKVDVPLLNGEVVTMYLTMPSFADSEPVRSVFMKHAEVVRKKKAETPGNEATVRNGFAMALQACARFDDGESLSLEDAQMVMGQVGYISEVSEKVMAMCGLPEIVPGMRESMGRRVPLERTDKTD